MEKDKGLPDPGQSLKFLYNCGITMLHIMMRLSIYYICRMRLSDIKRSVHIFSPHGSNVLLALASL